MSINVLFFIIVGCLQNRWFRVCCPYLQPKINQNWFSCLPQSRTTSLRPLRWKSWYLESWNYCLLAPLRRNSFRRRHYKNNSTRASCQAFRAQIPLKHSNFQRGQIVHPETSEQEPWSKNDDSTGGSSCLHQGQYQRWWQFQTVLMKLPIVSIDIFMIFLYNTGLS